MKQPEILPTWFWIFVAAFLILWAVFSIRCIYVLFTII